MQYISLNVQTTGLDPDKHQILELAAIAEDTTEDVNINELPLFHAYIKRDNYIGSAEGLSLNIETLKYLASDNLKDLWDERCLAEELFRWMCNNIGSASYCFEDNEITLAGKNIGSFDYQFLKKLPDSERLIYSISHNFIDPTMLYMDFKNDICLPSTRVCWSKLKLPYVCNFKAVDVAKSTIGLLREKY